MLNKQALLDVLQEEADTYEGAKDERGKAVREMNLALIDEIRTGRFDIKGSKRNKRTESDCDREEPRPTFRMNANGDLIRIEHGE